MSMQLNANPWDAADNLEFKFVSCGTGHIHGTDISNCNNILSFNVTVQEWYGATKFFIGLVTLIVIITAQIFSCFYMAKKNKRKLTNN